MTSNSAEPTWIEAVNPLVKITAVLSLGISVMIFPSLWFGVAVLVGLFVVAGAAGLIAPFSKLMLSFGIPITVMLLFIQGGYSGRNQTVLAQIGFFTLGLEGTLYAMRIVLTVLVFLGSFFIMNRTTAPSRLVGALTSTGMSPKAGYLILSSLNVVPQMQRRLGVIREAQEARGLSVTGGPLSRMKAYVPLLGPVVMSSLTDAQERGMTLETRGFGLKGVKRTSYVEVPFRRVDALACLGFVLVLVAVAIITFMWGR